MHFKTWRIAAAALIVAGLGCAAENWPQFRGPDGQGHADDANLPLTWSCKENQNVVWRTPLPGLGWSSPVIRGGQLWMTTATGNGASLRALCVDKATGRLLHDIEVFRPAKPFAINPLNSHATPTPVIEEGRLYVHFGPGGTACLDTTSGAILWKTEEFQAIYAEGPVSSPVLYRNLLIITCDGMDVQFVAALDKQTGKQVWKAPRAGKLKTGIYVKAYSTPLVARVKEQDQLISSSADWVYGYEPLTGKEIWRVGFDGYNAPPRPVAGNELVYVCTGHDKHEVLAVRPDGQGDATATHIVWRQNKNMPLTSSLILVGRELYAVNDTGKLTCLDALTGGPIWTGQIPGTYGASPIVAGGRLYFCSESGVISVVAVGREFKVLATNSLAQSEQPGQKETVKASPAVCGNALFIRSDKALYRLEEAAVPDRAGK